MENARSAPTGCYKCGRPGHWSRDCPSSSASAPAPTVSDDPNTSSRGTNSTAGSSGGGGSNFKPAPAPKPNKVVKGRPKLTPEILLSDEGLGYILRYFPRAFKYRGRGNEVFLDLLINDAKERDLGNLIRLYEEWHSQLLPYYPFDQFVHKVEQVAASKRVKLCIKDLRERVATGGDPTNLRERPGEHEDTNKDQEAMQFEAPDDDNHHVDPISEVHHPDDAEDMLNEIYQTATEDMNISTVAADSVPNSSSRQESPDQVPNKEASCPGEGTITEEQRARMEANRLKALERVGGSSSAEVTITEEQRARMEANRLKALERAAAARARSLQAA